MRRLLPLLLLVGFSLGHPSISHAQPQLDSEYLPEERPALPPSISPEPVRIQCVYAYLWKQPDGTQVVSAYGDFRLTMGEYRLRSRDAVVWFRSQTREQASHLELEVFLWQDAEVLQPAGTTESGPALLVTLASAGELKLSADSHVLQSDESSPLYERGALVRQSLQGAPAPTTTGPVGVRDTERTLPVVTQRAPRRIDYSGRDLSSEMVEGRRVVIAIGDVRVSQGEGRSAEALELKADAAVLYLSESATDLAPGFGGAPGSEPPRSRTTRPSTDDAAPSAASEPPLQGTGRTERETVAAYVTGAYLEGDVVLMRGTRMIRAERLYYDFEAERALILDAVMRAFAADRAVPVYVRAEQVRQLSSSEYFARRAKISTSEFQVPHVALGSTRAYLSDNTPRNERGEIIGIQAGTYRAYNTTLEVEGVPVAYWPVARGDFTQDTQALEGIRTGYNNRLGAAVETRWYLFNLLGMERPPGYNAIMRLDYFGERGPGTGIDLDYVRENYYGLLRSYFIYDQGEDQLGPIRSGPPDTETRGRLLWRHRQYLPQDWQLVLETAYLSDRDFLESWYRNEFENAKDQENVIFLLKRRENWQFQTLFNWRLNDFLTQTEHFPDAVFSLIGEPLADWVTLYSEQRAGVVRYKGDDYRVFPDESNRADNTGSTSSVVRGDAREELRFPLPVIGPVKVTPYLAGRATAWDDSKDNGGRTRVFGSAGLNANMYLQRTYDQVESQILDLHRMRHIIKPEVNVWAAGADRDSWKIAPFDSDVEKIDGFSGVTLGLRQRWQTQRGGPGRWRTVDWITFDVEAGFFSDPRRTDNTRGDFIFSRPEDSISSNFVTGHLAYRISETTALVYDGTIDLNRGNAGSSTVSLNIERDPRLAWFVGYRYIHDTDNNLIGFGANYRLNDKHTVVFREFYDIEFSRNYSTQISLIRRWPRWYTGVTFDFDNAIDEYGINLTAWPEGAPNLALGSRRLTGVGDSIGLRP